MNLISIITPSYNSGEFISWTMQSVFSQTYPNWELLIIDDCSSDNTISIVKEFAERDPRIRYFSTIRNTGSPSQPRNIGIEQAKGDYIAFLDSDDIWLPDKLEEQLAFMQEHGYDFVYSNYEKMSWDGKREQRIVKVKGSASYKDILKMSAVLGFYLAALFLWEDHIAITNIAVYDNHTIPVLFYGLVEIITFFMYLVRVANNKGWYMSETQILNGWHHINKFTLKNISIVIFYACVAFAAYSFVTLLYYSLHNILNIAIVDGYFINFSHNIRKMIVLFIFLGFFLLFKSKHDIFSIFLIGFIVICELYIIIYNSLNNMLPLYMIFKLEYVYTTVNVILFIISINIAKYTKIMSYGLLFSVVLFIISLINVFTEVSYSNTPVVFYILYITIIISNVIVATGAYKKIKQYS